MSRRLLPGVAAALALAVLVGCTSTDEPSAAPPGSPPPTAASAPTRPGDEGFAGWDRDRSAAASARLSALVDDTGTIPTATLVAWWATLSPVDGVTPLPADQVADLDTELLLRGLTERPDVPPAVADDVTARLEAARTGTTPIVGTGTGTGTGPTPPTTTASGPVELRSGQLRATATATGTGTGTLDQAGAEAIVIELVGELERRYGATIALPLYVHVADAAALDPVTGLLLFTGPRNGASTVGIADEGVFRRCDTYLRSDVGSVELGSAWFRSAVAHEIYHCHQNGIVPDQAQLDAVPRWIVEGQAAWVGEDVAGGSPWSSIWWPGWIDRPEATLRRRVYDAIPLYDRTEAYGGDLASRFDTMLVSPATAFAVLTGDHLEDVRRTWPTTLVNDASWGEPWTLTGHRVPDGSAPRIHLALPAGATVRPTDRQPIDWAASLFELDLASVDILRITVGVEDRGALRFAGGETMELQGGLTFGCLTATACDPCPEGPPPATGGRQFPASQGPALLALNLLGEPGAITLQALRRDDVCGPDPVTGSTADICTVLTDAEVAAVMGSAVVAETPITGGGCGWDTEAGSSLDLEIYPSDAGAAAGWKDLFILGPDLRWSAIGLGDVAAIDPNPKAAFPNVDIHFGGVGAGHTFDVKVWNAPGVDQGDAIDLVATLLGRL